mgnify:CR=1 FL=1
MAHPLFGPELRFMLLDNNLAGMKAFVETLNPTTVAVTFVLGGVVILLVAAGVFAQGLMSVGFIEQLLQLGQENQWSALCVMLLLVLISALLSP